MTAQNPPIFLQAGSHPAEDVRQALTAIVGSAGGVVGASDLVVSERAGTANMSVDVAGGQAWVAGTESTYQGAYFCENRGVQNITVSLGDATNPRIDIVVARVKDSAYSGGSDAWELALIEGTAAASPTQPTAPANSITLARIDVAAGASSVVNGDITDLRTFVAADQMRIVGDLVVDTDTLYVDSTNDRVGIGTTSPADKLEVEGTGATYARVSSSDATGAAGVTLHVDTDTTANDFWTIYQSNGTSHGLRFYKGGLGDAVTFTSSGNVGINDSTPSYTLDVNGDINATGDLRIAGNPIGERVAFTPSWVNFTPGNATETWFYVQVNKLLFVYGTTTLGSTSAITGSVRLTIPTGLRSGDFHSAGSLQLRDNSGSNYSGSWRIRSDANQADLQCQNSSGTYVTEVGVTATVPFTWTTGDVIRGSFTVALQ